MTEPIPLKAKHLSIGETSRRSGVRSTTLRYYEKRGLISSVRTQGNQRIYHREMLRRISIIRIAQTLGLTLSEITGALNELPNQRTPTKRDWERLSKKWQKLLNDRIAQMERMRDNLSGCIGCGCLSLKKCSLFNKEDHVAINGPGPRLIIDD